MLHPTPIRLSLLVAAVSAPAALATAAGDDDPAGPAPPLFQTTFECISNGHATSPPGFPDIRQADDFYVGGGGWLVTELRFLVVEDAPWQRGDALEVFLYDHDGGDTPGREVRAEAFAFDAQFTGEQGFSRDVYEYWVTDVVIAVEPGGHWIGHRNPQGAGAGTVYWVEYSELDCQPDDDAFGTFPNASSFDRGETWASHESPYHFAYDLYGYPTRDARVDAFAVVAGELVAGDTRSLAASDDDRLVIEARRSDGTAIVVVEGAGGVGAESLCALGFSVETAVSDGGVIETIDLFDFEAGAYETLQAGPGPPDDTRVDVAVTDDAARFVEPGTRALRARLRYTGPPGESWTAAIDLAAWREGCPPMCAEDLDGDGLVGYIDLVTLLTAWGACPDCPEDLDDNGTVDLFDLLQLLTAWGPC